MDKTAKNLTSYDLLKAAAVLLMIVDHIGYYFYPDELWFRVVGRFCVPVWFFLIGYARSRDLSPSIWIGAGVLLVANILAGMPLFPLNVLVSMILIRLCLDRVMLAMTRNTEIFIIFSVMLTILALPTYILTEYGTQGLLLAIFGYLARNKTVLPGARDAVSLLNGFCVFIILNFVGLQVVNFGFDTPQSLALLGGIIAVCLLLTVFQPMEYPRLTSRLPGFLRTLVIFLGRWTLEIYVAHLILFKILGIFLDPARFPLLQLNVL